MMTLGDRLAAALIVALIASVLLRSIDGALAALVLLCAVHLMRSM
jgi:hypothetical protein